MTIARWSGRSRFGRGLVPGRKGASRAFRLGSAQTFEKA
jgi:hypothetical protein